MDPGSALGIASAIITFIDFSWSLITGTIEVYRNGRVKDDQDIETITSDLESITDDLRNGAPGSSRAEKSIANLSEKCLATSQELQKLFRPLVKNSQNKRTIWKSFKTQWAITTGKEKIDELSFKLQGYREQLMLNLALLLRDDKASLNVQMHAIQDSFSDLNLGLATKLTSLRDDLIEALEKETTPQAPPNHPNGEAFSLIDSLEDLKRMIAYLQSSIIDMPIQQRILRQLAYQQMPSRHSAIVSPEAGTLQWIFSQADPIDKDATSADRQFQDVRTDASQKYLTWLEAGTGVFHLSGNTGSGKSALMKYIAGHDVTKKKLELWAGTQTLVLADFYFWAPGNDLQRSLEGLHRTILFGALSQHPELMEKIFPQQWRRLKASRSWTDPLVEGIQEFGQRRIEEAFAMLTESRDFSGYKFCFFIDGLDELSGDKQDHENLAEQICGWAKAENVKVCASSRPYREFLDIFQSSGHTTIYLHQLNKSDIYAYCREKLGQDRKGKNLPEQDREELIRAIAKKSQGVFLWTFLVVRQLLNALRNEDPLRVLRKRVDEVPVQLEELYAKSLESIGRSKIDRERAFRILLLALENLCPWPIDALSFSWIPGFDDGQSQGLQDADFPNATMFECYSKDEAVRTLSRVKAQVQGLTRDFLETKHNDNIESGFRPYQGEDFSNWTVEFFHRSARDYLWDNKVQRALIRHYLMGLHALKDGTTLFWELQATINCRGVYEPYWVGLRPINWSTYQTIVYDLISKSLVHIAAYFGLEKFVLDGVDRNPEVLRTDNNLNLLVSAVMATQGPPGTDLVGELLDRHVDLEGMHPVKHWKTGLIEKWPVWVIVSISLFQRIIPRNEPSPDIIRNLIRMSQLIIDKDWSLKMTFWLYPFTESKRQSRAFDLGEILRFDQALALESEMNRFNRWRRWVRYLCSSDDHLELVRLERIVMREATWEPR
ncbi:hypothetical protein PFICI_13595 [Pestalotiopsis fici W106-1]|uniref:NACHT domain-containing protein n=1 Tax=Pestalotiopsis fici (strain W106-1 / CGMCC3.15140) TaxID=1229662 RepID=W3WQK0_PESFW|nr:uncharacterized protein PFICI_13595 [Pestalotiopsis fici W106-1]ETS75111.1 hypothetical protein PFICI_13595 [Pestalotiopsis fici W106-1]